MTATFEQFPTTCDDQPATSLALVVELDGDDDTALLRVLSLLARRRCRVHSATFAPEPARGGAELRLELDVPERLGPNLIAWVSALVAVRSVAGVTDPR